MSEELSKHVQFAIYDSLFGHAKAASNGNLGLAPKHLTFSRDNEPSEVSFFTDLDLEKTTQSTSKIKIAWLIESPEVHAASYSYISRPENYRNFTLILTFDKRLLELDKRFVLVPAGGCWIPEKERILHPKTRNISIIASKKNDLPGQQLRQKVISKLEHKIDGVFGRGYQEIDNKADGLRDFRYSIVIENCRADYYFTEKIIDCFVTGTVPLYWGCPSIDSFFDPAGILTFDSIDDLDEILDRLDETDYQNRLSSIQKNFELAQKYAVTEDYIFEEVITKHRVFSEIKEKLTT